jgi:hypothetical protein
LRTSFCVPVWQNEQVSVQPTCGDVDRLDLVAASNAQQVFSGAVGGKLPGDNLGPGDLELLGQQAAIGLGQIGHRLEIGNPALVDPLPQLAGAHPRLTLRRARLYQGGAQALAGQAQQIYARPRLGLARQGGEIRLDHGLFRGLDNCLGHRVSVSVLWHARIRGLPRAGKAAGHRPFARLIQSGWQVLDRTGFAQFPSYQMKPFGSKLLRRMRRPLPRGVICRV